MSGFANCGSQRVAVVLPTLITRQFAHQFNSIQSNYCQQPHLLLHRHMLPELLSTSATIFSIHEYLPSDNGIAVMMTQQGPCDS